MEIYLPCSLDDCTESCRSLVWISQLLKDKAPDVLLMRNTKVELELCRDDVRRQEPKFCRGSLRPSFVFAFNTMVRTVSFKSVDSGEAEECRAISSIERGGI